MKHILLIIVAILSFTIILKSQSTPSICDSLNNYWENFFKQFDYSSVTYMESAPMLLTSNDSLRIRIKGQDSIFSSTNQFKAFVTFYVNEDGNPICLKVLKPNNILVQNIATSIIAGFKFKPAIIGGGIRIAPMVLQILFIKDK